MSRRKNGAVVAGILAFTLGAGQWAAGGELMGTVKFQGKPRAARKIVMDSDAKCVAMHQTSTYDEKFVYTKSDTPNLGTLANVFVWVKSGLPAGKTYPVPSTPVILNQKGCAYQPHVLGIMVGQELHITNSDPTMHNVHALPKVNREFNNGQPPGTRALVKKFTKPEVMLKFKCDAHTWMSAYLGVVDHPFYAVTGKDGSFTIKDLPAGTYEIGAIHELVKSKTQTVTVKDGTPTTVAFVFSKPQRK